MLSCKQDSVLSPPIPTVCGHSNSTLSLHVLSLACLRPCGSATSWGVGGGSLVHGICGLGGGRLTRLDSVGPLMPPSPASLGLTSQWHGVQGRKRACAVQSWCPELYSVAAKPPRFQGQRETLPWLQGCIEWGQGAGRERWDLCCAELRGQWLVRGSQAESGRRGWCGGCAWECMCV